MDFDPVDIETAITNFGDLAVVGPAAVLIWIWVAWHRGVPAAILYQWPILACVAVTVVLKMVSRNINGALRGSLFELSTGAPSGHVAMSTVVYGGVALLLLRRGPEPINLLTALLVVVTLVGIGVTRVLLNAHTPADVAAGLLIGGGCAIWVGRVAEVPARETMRDTAQLVMLLVGLVLILHLAGVSFDSAEVL